MRDSSQALPPPLIDSEFALRGAGHLGGYQTRKFVGRGQIRPFPARGEAASGVRLQERGPEPRRRGALLPSPDSVSSASQTILAMHSVYYPSRLIY